MAKNLYSPSMFKNYLNCKYIIFNEFYQEKLNLKKKEVSESDKLRFAKGIQFENDYFDELKKKLTGNLYDDMDIHNSIYEIKKQMNPEIVNNPQLDQDECEACGS